MELENTAEGYVPAEVLADDYYICDEKNYRMIGERRKRIFAIGDRIRVRVDRVNTMTGDIDLSPAEEEGTGTKTRAKRRKKKVAEETDTLIRLRRKCQRFSQSIPQKKNGTDQREGTIGKIR